MTDKIIDVYLGFMDEEVNTVLKGLIEKEVAKKDVSTRRPIVLIERGHVNPAGPILEWPLSRYGVGVKRVAYASKEGVSDAPAHPGHDISHETTFVEHILARAMHAFLESDSEAERQLRERNIKVLRMIDVRELQSMSSGPKLKVPLEGRGPELSVVRFDLGDADATLQAPIVVLRSPEMGLQPSLMSPYIEFVLMAVSALSSQLAYLAEDKAEWPLRIGCFGAQGGASSTKSPGSISTICASLYVGYEYSDGARDASIALCSQGGVYTFKADAPLRWDDLLNYFIVHNNELVVSKIDVDERYRRREEADIRLGMKLRDVVALLVRNYRTQEFPEPEVSGTSSWFISADQKKAFADQGITGCNMEDYWVLRTMRRCALERAAKEPSARSMYPVFKQGFLTRVNADPLRIEDPVVEAFQTDLRSKRLTNVQYAQLLLWGLMGVPLQGDGDAGMPPIARWLFTGADVFKGKDGHDTFARHLYGLLVDKDVVVPDPFFIEIATDLLKESAGLPGSKGSVFARPPADANLQRIARAAHDAQVAWEAARQTPTEAVKRTLLVFVDTLAREADFGTAENMKVWLRPGGKWEGINANSIQDLGTAKFNHAAVDRAFYKASNLIALQEYSTSILR